MAGRQCGPNNPFWGHSHSPETRLAISIAKKKQGLKPWLGKCLPDSMKEKISQSKKGCEVWNAGKDMSPEYRARISAVRREWWAGWRQRHPDYKERAHQRNSEKSRQRWKMDINYRLKKILRNRMYCALRGLYKSGGLEILIGCSVEQLKAYLEKKFEPGMGWENQGEWHVDHILPCASFDLNDPAQQRECFHFTNLQPLWARDNLQKWAKTSAEVA